MLCYVMLCYFQVDAAVHGQAPQEPLSVSDYGRPADDGQEAAGVPHGVP